jgi:hypothetical protein
MNGTLWKTNGNEKLENGTITQKPSTDAKHALVAWYKLPGLPPSNRSVSLRVNVTKAPELIRVYIGMLKPRKSANFTFTVEIKQMKNVTSHTVQEEPIASDVLKGDPEDYETTFTMHAAVSDAGKITLALKDFENGRSDELYELGTYGPTDGLYVGIQVKNGVTGGRINVDNWALPSCEGTGEYMALQKYVRLALAK